MAAVLFYHQCIKCKQELVGQHIRDDSKCWEIWSQKEGDTTLDIRWHDWYRLGQVSQNWIMRADKEYAKCSEEKQFDM